LSNVTAQVTLGKGRKNVDYTPGKIERTTREEKIIKNRPEHGDASQLWRGINGGVLKYG